MGENTAEKRPDVEAIMARIREQVKADLAEAPTGLPRYQGKAPELNAKSSQSILYSEELNYLNAHWHNWNSTEEITSHRPIIGPIIVRIKRFFVDLAWNYMFKGYFERERQFQMHLVRYLNNTARYIDGRDAEIFWELVGKIDNEAVLVNERVDRLYDEAHSTVRGIEQEVREQLHDVVTRVQDGAAGLAVSSENGSLEAKEEFTNRLRDYAELFAGAVGTVLSIGCGNEFSQFLAQHKVTGKGADAAQLQSIDDKSLGGLFVQKLPAEELQQIVSLAARKVAPGGRVVFNALNLHPNTLRMVMEAAGLRIEPVMLSTPHPKGAALQLLEISNELPPRWQATLVSINDNIKRLNELLYSYQDYVIVGIVEDAAGDSQGAS